MNDELETLTDGYLDDQLSDKGMARLSTGLIEQNPEHASRFARAMLMHDRLHAEAQTDALVATTAPPRRPDAVITAETLVPSRDGCGGRRLDFGRHSVAWRDQPDRLGSRDGARSHDRSCQPTVDRVYRIRVSDPGAEGAAPQVFSGGQGRKPGIDGAELYIRGLDQFVLVRHFGNGTDFVTGSDGTIGWAIAPKGPVHLSHDTRRFRRAVPGEHEELPFADLQAGLIELRRSYNLTLASIDSSDGQSKGESEIVAIKKPGRRPGPERVVIRFAAAGVAHRIELFGLPPDGYGLGPSCLNSSRIAS